MRKFLPLLIFLIAGCEPSPDTRENEPVTLGDSIANTPFLTAGSAGDMYLSWTQQRKDTASLHFIKYSSSGWSEPGEIVAGESWFVNWADYPVIASGEGGMMAHYLKKSAPGTYNYDIELVISGDEGQTWQAAGKLNSDGKAAEHGFVSITPFNDQFFVTWLDGRNTASHDEGHSPGAPGAMTLRAALLNPDGTKANEWEVDDRVCDCCQTSGAISANGPVVVYRDRSENEIRDIFISRLTDGTWSAPLPVHSDGWQIDGCPVNGPRIVANNNDLAVAWFTAADKDPRVLLAFSGDNGETFSAPVRLPGEQTTGRTDIEWLSENDVLVTYMSDQEIKAARVSKAGSITGEYTIVPVSESRSSGFPQLVRNGGDTFVAWTDNSTGRIKVVKFLP